MTQAQSHYAINIDEVFDSLQRPLALVEDQQRREDMQRFLDAARIHQERAVVDLISDMVAKVNEASGDTRVRLEYQAREFRLAVETNTPEPDTGDPMTRMDGDLEKVTIRLPKILKDRIDQAVSERGTSLNSWYVRGLARSVAHHTRGRPEGAGFGPPIGRGGRGRGRFGGGRDRD
jgi:hypothetical protein